MKTYTVKMSNHLTGQLKEKTVKAATAREAVSKARSTSMISNGWFIDSIQHDGIEVNIHN